MAKVNDEDVALATEAERTFLMALGGGCNFPIAAYAQVIGDAIKLDAMYASADGKIVLRDKIEGHKKLGVQLARDMMQLLRQKAGLEND